jgi:hypothetical protein
MERPLLRRSFNASWEDLAISRRRCCLKDQEQRDNRRLRLSEAIFRDDLDNSVLELGDQLVREGPALRAQKEAAAIFGPAFVSMQLEKSCPGR